MEEQHTTLRDYLRVVFRQKLVIFTSIITVMVTVYLGVHLRTPVYQSKVKILVSGEKQVESPYYREMLGYRDNQITLTQSEMVLSRPVLELAVRALGLDKKPLDYENKFAWPHKRRLISWRAKRLEEKLAAMPKDSAKLFMLENAINELRSSIKVEPVRDTSMFTITSSDFSPIGAAVIANTVSRAYVIFDLQQQLAELQLKYGNKHSTVLQLQDSIEKMTGSLNGQPLPDVEAIGPASVKVVEQASMPLEPAGPDKNLVYLLAALMSVFLGVMLAFACEYLDQTFKTPQEMEQFLNVPYLGFIPFRGRGENPLIKDAEKATPYVLAFRNLSDQLYLIMKDRGYKSLLVTSAEPSEGVTTIAANLGIYLSTIRGHKVLVIGANLRSQTMHTFFGIENKTGLSDVVQGKVELKEAVNHITPTLDVLFTGQSNLNPITILDSHKMAETVKEAETAYDLVLVDCANLGGYKDGLVVSSYVDSTVVVIDESKTRRQLVQAALSPLRQKKVNILGAILNNRTFAIPRIIYDRI